MGGAGHEVLLKKLYQLIKDWESMSGEMQGDSPPSSFPGEYWQAYASGSVDALLRCINQLTSLLEINDDNE